MKSYGEAKNGKLKGTKVQNSLKEEILQLQQQLDDQLVVRFELLKGSSYKPLFHETTTGNSISKPAEDLIREIAILESEVMNLEKYLLTMYRRTFEKSTCFSTKDEKLKTNTGTREPNASEHSAHDSRSLMRSSMIKSSSFQPLEDPSDNPSNECGRVFGTNTLLDSSIHRCHSSLSQTAARSFRISPPRGTCAEALHSFHSLPLSMLEDGTNASLAEHVITKVSTFHARETPNWLSEEMLKCVSAIYCQLAEPPLFNCCFPSSPISLYSSASDSPLHYQSDARSSKSRENSSLSSCLNNQFHEDDSRELTGCFSTMVELQGIRRDAWNLKSVEHMLQNFRSLVSRLEEVDPRKMKHEEKLAFWINVHNVLVMHAFLVYGIPQSSMKRTSLLLKAAYNIGGHTVNVDMIQSYILGCRLPRPGQWFQSLFFPKSKFKARDARKAYAIVRPQPLLQFALCSGSQSDPMVRIYTPKRVYQELEMAKEEYIQSTCRIQKEHKIHVPKIVESYAKASGLSSANLIQTIEHSMLYFVRNSFQQPQKQKLTRKIEWIPHNFTFRYLISPELAK